MITIFAWLGYDLPKKKCFNLIKQAGFDGIILWWDCDFGDENFRENPEFPHAQDFALTADI